VHLRRKQIAGPPDFWEIPHNGAQSVNPAKQSALMNSQKVIEEMAKQKAPSSRRANPEERVPTEVGTQ
jgi:hypothetical protein